MRRASGNGLAFGQLRCNGRGAGQLRDAMPQIDSRQLHNLLREKSKLFDFKADTANSKTHRHFKTEAQTLSQTQAKAEAALFLLRERDD